MTSPFRMIILALLWKMYHRGDRTKVGDSLVQHKSNENVGNGCIQEMFRADLVKFSISLDNQNWKKEGDKGDFHVSGLKIANVISCKVEYRDRGREAHMFIDVHVSI